MDDAKTIFGKRLRLIRKAKGMTLEELGKAVSIGYKHIAAIERGEKVPSFDAIDRLVKTLRVSPYELFLPYDLDNASLDRALRHLVLEISDNGSPALKRSLLIALPLLRQLEAESSR